MYHGGAYILQNIRSLYKNTRRMYHGGAYTLQNIRSLYKNEDILTTILEYHPLNIAILEKMFLSFCDIILSSSSPCFGVFCSLRFSFLSLEGFLLNVISLYTYVFVIKTPVRMYDQSTRKRYVDPKTET